MGKGSDAIADISLSIGRLCREWADLELTITQIFVSVATKSAYQAPSYLLAMSDCLDFRDKLSAIRLGVVASAHGVSTRAWAEEVVATINYIDNQLRPRRNRLVHDLWRPHSRGAKRLTVAPKIYRQQSFRPFSYHFGASAVETVTSVQDTADDVRAHDEWALALMRWRYLNKRSPLPELLSGRPARPLLRPPPGKPSRLGKG
jgi:hypothetical protein